MRIVFADTKFYSKLLPAFQLLLLLLLILSPFSIQITDHPPMNQYPEPKGRNPKHPCKICSKTIAKTHRKVKCKTCNFRIHIKCNNTDPSTYDSLPNNKVISFCRSCAEDNIPFQSLEEKDFITVLHIKKKRKAQAIGLAPTPPCKVCCRKIANNHRKLLCKNCNEWMHIKCNKTDPITYNKLVNKEIDLCLKCTEFTLPFQALDDEEFELSVANGVLADITNLALNPPSESMKAFFKEINNLGQQSFHEDDETPCIDCKYVDIQSFKHKVKKNQLSLFHLNIASLSKHKEELDTTLSMLNFEFDVIGLTETKIKKNVTPSVDIKRKNYKEYSTPTEGDKGGCLLYISEKFDSKPRKDLEKIMYKPKALESTFREIINTKGRNIITGCIYRHPSMEMDDFNEQISRLFN